MGFWQVFALITIINLLIAMEIGDDRDNIEGDCRRRRKGDI